MGLQIAQMWDAADGKLVDMSSDTLPGLPTQEQILDLRVKNVPPTREGGFGYLRGPDGAMIENAQAGTVERFNHVHMYHEHPRCAMEWYTTHLGAKIPQGRGGSAPAPATGDCRTRRCTRRRRGRRSRKPDSFASRRVASSRRHPDSRFARGRAAGSSARAASSWIIGPSARSNLDATVTRLKGENVKFLEDIHPWGTMRAAMIEGPDRIAIEIVEGK